MGRPQGAGAGDPAGRLEECIKALVRRFSLAERADVEYCGLTVAQAAALDVLRRHGRSMRLGDLGRRLGISPSTLSRNLTRLEERRLVSRAPDPEDGRAFLVALTASGGRAARAVGEQNAAFAASVLDHLGTERAKGVVDALYDLIDAVQAATGDCCPGAFDHLMSGQPWASRDRVG